MCVQSNIVELPELNISSLKYGLDLQLTPNISHHTCPSGVLPASNLHIQLHICTTCAYVDIVSSSSIDRNVASGVRIEMVGNTAEIYTALLSAIYEAHEEPGYLPQYAMPLFTESRIHVYRCVHT